MSVSDSCSTTSELDSFLSSRWEPLLQIIKQLTARIHKVEAAGLHEAERLGILEAEVTELRQGMQAFSSAAFHSGVGGSQIPPSQTGSIISTPGARLSLGNLEADSGNIHGRPSRLSCSVHESLPLNIPGECEDTMSAPWLFQVAATVPLAIVQSTLGFDVAGTVTATLDSLKWVTEVEMWKDVSMSLQPAGGLRSTAARTSVQSGGADWHEAAMEALGRACLGEVLLVVQNVPSREELALKDCLGDTASGIGSASSEGWSKSSANGAFSGSAQSRIRCVAKLAVEAQQQWETLSSTKSVEELGRLAMVLVGDGIGKTLKAGSKRFPIEPLL